MASMKKKISDNVKNEIKSSFSAMIDAGNIPMKELKKIVSTFDLSIESINELKPLLGFNKENFYFFISKNQVSGNFIIAYEEFMDKASFHTIVYSQILSKDFIKRYIHKLDISQLKYSIGYKSGYRKQKNELLELIKQYEELL
jgi:hypothetical protein